MEAQHAMDCAPWRDAVGERARRAVAGAVDELGGLPVLDATVLRVLALCDDPEATAADLVDELERDAAFAANLLRFANSAARSQPIRARTIRQAVMLVGRRALRRISIEAATYRFLETAKGNGGAAQGQLHVHAITVGLCAAAAAERAGHTADDAHLGGLLHDVGKLVLPLAFGAERCDAIARRTPTGAERALAEREAFGIDHAQAGALLCERWRLPGEIAAIVAWHHGGPTGIGSPSTPVAAVQVADVVAGMLAGHEADHALLEVALAKLGLAADALDDVARHASPAAGGADRLAERVSELERLSQTDELTGLANRRHWLQTVRQVLAGDGAGSVLLCDVDHFKAVNDRHGFAAGDLVLTELARVLGQQGHAGRLGGDEFAVWIPGPLAEADAAAGRVVALVAESFEASAGPKVDLSIGTAAAPDHGTDLASLLEAADVALMEAKRAGRSRAASYRFAA